jgi:hypothetical protein
MLKTLPVALLALIVSGCATHAVTSGRFVVQERNAVVEVAFSSHDRRLVHEYYETRRHKGGKKTPPGLAKRDRLPPGLAKRDTLPPGLQGRGLPGDLESRMTSLPVPYVRVVIGGDIVLMNSRTRVVMDVIQGVAD